MQYDVDENEEFNSYTDATQIGKRIFMAPDPAIFSSKFFLTKVKATRVMHLSQEKYSKNQTSKNNTSKEKKKVSFQKYKNKPNDVVSRSIRFANEFINSGGFHVKDVSVPDSNLDAATSFELGNDNFKKGWARRKVLDGRLYGRKFIKDYKDDVAEYTSKEVLLTNQIK